MYPERFKFELIHNGSTVLFEGNSVSSENFLVEVYSKIYRELVEEDHLPSLEVNNRLEVMLTYMTPQSLIAFGAILNKIENEDQLLQDVPEL